MAGIREIARQYKDVIMDGIAWVAIWKEGKSWKAQDFWLNTDTDKIEDEDMDMARDIVAADARAIFINEYFCAHMGEGKLEDIVNGIRFFYENGYNTLEDNTAYEPGEDITKEEKKEEIREIAQEVSNEDKDWEWGLPIIRMTVRFRGAGRDGAGMDELNAIRRKLKGMAEKEAQRLFRLARRAAAHGCRPETLEKIMVEAWWLHETATAYPDRLLRQQFEHEMKYAFKCEGWKKSAVDASSG